MFYIILLSLHSITRWLVLLAAFYAIFRAIAGFTNKKAWTKRDDQSGIWFTSIIDLQLIFGLVLLFVTSPITTAAFRDFGGAMANAITRYFTVEHTLVMLIGLVLAHVGRALSKKASSDRQKFQRAAIWFSISLLLILLAIPWPFLAVGRPLFRFG